MEVLQHEFDCGLYDDLVEANAVEAEDLVDLFVDELEVGGFGGLGFVENGSLETFANVFEEVTAPDDFGKVGNFVDVLDSVFDVPLDPMAV